MDVYSSDRVILHVCDNQYSVMYLNTMILTCNTITYQLPLLAIAIGYWKSNLFEPDESRHYRSVTVGTLKNNYTLTQTLVRSIINFVQNLYTAHAWIL